MRRLVVILLVAILLAGASLLIPRVRAEVRALVRPEPPPQITPLAMVTLPTRTPTASPTEAPTAQPAETSAPSASPADPTATARRTARPPRTSQTPTSLPPPTQTATPEPTPTSGLVVVGGRIYDAYIPAASKQQQFYQYTCEFDAAWVILETYGIATDLDDLIAAVGVDTSVEPYIEETGQGFIIHGGNIADAFSGDYKKNFLARSSGEAVRKAFERYGLRATPVGSREGVEAALRGGSLVWIKTTVDFKPWRPATWRMPDGRTRQTVLGNDHAVVVIGFNSRGVVIRDVLGPTSSNLQRPYEYEVDWEKFLAAWGAQAFDGLAVAPPAAPR